MYKNPRLNINKLITSKIKNISHFTFRISKFTDPEDDIFQYEKEKFTILRLKLKTIY